MILNIQDITKTYHLKGVSVHALRGITLQVAKGGFISIMGPSGSGKSTLMNIIGCLDKPEEGYIEFEGTKTSKMGKAELAYFRNKKIGFIFQSFNLLPRINALKNVMLPLLYSNYPKEKRQESAIKALGKVGLGNHLFHKPNEMSGGQQQRVAIARALINDPGLILADEPTGNVDSVSGLGIIALMQELNNSGMTIILVTHDRSIALHTDRIIHIKDGRIIKIEEITDRKDAKEELKNIPREDLTYGFI
ncbi:MAG: ABC transporter ATP-binding protein [Thermodesulfobacteriota bacterium]|nr:ABC transporter ATP-binding protein [Thermodesulfobacteriota bacterium]